MVQITHKLNRPCISQVCGSCGMGIAISTPGCIFVMGHACSHMYVHPLYTCVATLTYVISVYYVHLLKFIYFPVGVDLTMRHHDKVSENLK